MRRFLRNVLYGLIHYTGINAWWRHRNRDKLTVLFIHGVEAAAGTPGMKPSRWQLSDAQLDRQMAMLTPHYTFVSLEDAKRVIDGELKTPKPAALFTSDDGYVSTFRLAWPILKRHQVPAVVFVATGQMQSGWPFWWDRLDYAFLHMKEPIDAIHLGDHRIRVNTSTAHARGVSARMVTRLSRTLIEDEPLRHAELNRLIKRYEVLDSVEDLNAWVGVMGPDEVRAADADGLTIGSHTVNHYRLGQLTGEALEKEMQSSKSTLETLLAKPCVSLCYPEGSVNQVAVDAARDAGYSIAFVSERGLNSVGDDPLTLKRIHLPEHAGKAELAVLVSGFGDFLARFRRRLMSRST